jgi:GAF domain-containing protein
VLESLPFIELASLALLLVGIGLAFSHIHLSGWVLGWILLSGALLVQWFRSILGYSFEHGGVDPGGYQIANDWMGLGFSLLIVASMYMMREVLARHSLAEERLRVISAVAQDARALTAIFKAESGIRGAFALPVKAEGKTIGVFAFNSHEIREPDAQLLAAVRAICSQVGQFLHRKHGEAA